MTHPATDSGLLLIISGPSGVGKTTITRRVVDDLGAVYSVSVTTRRRSNKESPGRDYHFLELDEFECRRDAGQLLEWAEVFGNYYGTPRQPVEEAVAGGRLVLLEIDVEGTVQVKQKMPEAFAIFILPPSEDELLRRLRNRQRESEQVIQERFAKAKHEIERARTSNAYEVFLVNDQLEQAMAEAVRLVREGLVRRGHGA